MENFCRNMKRKFARRHYADGVGPGSTYERGRDRTMSRFPLGEIPSAASTVWKVSREVAGAVVAGNLIWVNSGGRALTDLPDSIRSWLFGGKGTGWVHPERIEIQTSMHLRSLRVPEVPVLRNIQQCVQLLAWSLWIFVAPWITALTARA
jgi:hypothetical protein